MINLLSVKSFCKNDNVKTIQRVYKLEVNYVYLGYDGEIYIPLISESS